MTETSALPIIPPAQKSWILQLFVPWMIWCALAAVVVLIGPILLAKQASMLADPNQQEAARALINLQVYGSLFFFSATSLIYVWQVNRINMFPRAVAILACAALVGNFIVDMPLLVMPKERLLIPVLWPGTPERALWGSMMLLIAAPLFGDLLARGVEERTHIIPALLVAAMADYWSVYYGVTKVLAQKPEILQKVMVSFPVITHQQMPIMMQAMGATDWIFLGFLVSFARKFGLPQKRLLPTLALGIAIGLTAFLGFRVGIPLIPCIALAFIVCYLPHILPGKKEWRTTAVVIGAMALFFIVFQHMRPSKAPQQAMPSEQEAPSQMSTPPMQVKPSVQIGPSMNGAPSEQSGQPSTYPPAAGASGASALKHGASDILILSEEKARDAQDKVTKETHVGEAGLEPAHPIPNSGF